MNHILFAFVLTGCTLLGAAIGPDSFGYRAINGPVSWTDISATGTALFANSTDDGVVGPVDLGFDFAFYGVPHNQVFVSLNGLLTFTGQNAAFTNQDLTATNQVYPTLAAYWDDLVLANAIQNVYAQTLGTSGARRFVTQWTAAIFTGDSLPINVQAILFEGSNAIQFQYLNLRNADGGGATVGIANANGIASGQVLQWSFEGQLFGAPSAETSITFAPDAPVPEPDSLGLMCGGLLVALGMGRSRRS